MTFIDQRQSRGNGSSAGDNLRRGSQQYRPPQRAISRRRGRFLSILVIMFALLIVVRLVLVSMAPSSSYLDLSRIVGLNYQAITPIRGSILDRNGVVLAASKPAKTVVVDPAQVQNPIAEAQLLSRILNLPEVQIHAALIAPGQFAYVARQISDAQVSAIDSAIASAASHGLPDPLVGINLIDDPIRVNPNQAMAQSLIGRVTLYGEAQGGLENYFNSSLTGTAGTEIISSAPYNSNLPIPPKVVKESVPGLNVVTTLDTSIQLDAESALSAEMVASQARTGTVVVMNPTNGDIYAMVDETAGQPPNSTTPPVAPLNQPQPAFTFTQQSDTVNAVTDAYEPGSVAKIATFAAALKAGVVTPQTEIVVPDSIRVGASTFHDAEVHAPQIMTPKDILAQSSNVGTIMVASKLSPTTINKSFNNFGWGVPTGLNLHGSTYGYLDPVAKQSATARGAVPIGQDELATPLQVLDSYNVLAANGNLYTPRLALSIGGKAVAPKARRVISPSLAATMRSLMSGVTDANSTAPAAAVPGFAISGKTGTAQIAFPNNPTLGYIPGQYMATFVGFTTNSTVPLSAIVVLTEPKQLYGGATSAKVFSDVMTYALAHLGAKAGPSTIGMNSTPVATNGINAMPHFSLSKLPVSTTTSCVNFIGRVRIVTSGKACGGR